MTAHEFLKKYSSQKERITTGSKSVDQLLGGGIETGGITEIYGKYGTGKTQFVFQLCVNVQLPEKLGGLSSKAAFIDTEGTFNPLRIKQMSQALNLDPSVTLRNIYYKKALSLDDQKKATNNLKELVERENVKLIVIDSLINYFRSEFHGRKDLFRRQQELKKHLHVLNRLSLTENVAVVVTNHVMDIPDNLFEKEAVATGGHILAHTPVSILHIRKAGNIKRIIKLVDNPYLPVGEAAFIITQEGIRDIPY